MMPAATPGDVLHHLFTEIGLVHEGNLAQLGSMISLIDGMDEGAGNPAITEIRNRMANLLMLQGDEFQTGFSGLKKFLEDTVSAKSESGPAPATPEGAPEEGASPDTLYARLGGGPAIKAVVEAFYEKVVGDPSLGPLFNETNLEQLKRHQALFLSQALGGPKQYEGRELRDAHQSLGITPQQFQSVAGHLAETLRDFDVDPGDVDEVLAAVGSLQDQIVSPAPSAAEPEAAEPAEPEAAEAAEAAEPEAAADGIEEEGDEFADDIEPELYAEFVDDALSHLESIEMNFLNLETDPGNLKIVDELFRPFHTIKGVSGFLGLLEISRLCHGTENLLDDARKGRLEITGHISDLVLDDIDFLKEMLGAVRDAEWPRKELKRFRPGVDTRLEQLLRVKDQAAAGAEETASEAREKPLGEILVEKQVVSQQDLDQAIESQQAHGGQLGEILIKEKAVKPVEIAQALRGQQSQKADPDEVTSVVASDSLRVRISLLDQLMTLAGELVLGRNQLLQKLEAVSDTVPGLNSLLHNVDRVTSEVQEAVMQTRMQPLSGLFSRFHRVIRDLSRSMGKKINLTIEGETVELDKTLIEALTDPLTHLIRNCADHGIESPEQRAASGKREEGSVNLIAYHEGGRVYVKVSDDGAGIDIERIKEKAIEKGMISGENAAQMSDREAMRLLFKPGLSTVEKVTGVSGRGVGMDVVLSNIQNVGGTVEISSEPGKGTTFLLALPLTLAIIPALIVSASDQRFAIPQTNLLELVYMEGEEAKNAILEVRGSEVYSLRGEMLPLIRLDRVLKLAPPQEALDEQHALSIVVMAAGMNQFGLIVDSVYDTEEIVVQPLSNLLKDVEVFAGATLMGDGQAALILDISGVMKAAELSVGEEGADDSRGSKDRHGGIEESEDQTILLFNINPDEQMAVPLTIISRLETVHQDDIRTSIHGKVIPYRDRLLPLIFLEDHAKVAPPPPDRENYKILVFEIENPVGLVVTEIIDSLEIPVHLDDSAITPRGFTGLAIVNDQPTAFLDIYQMIEMAFPDWFQQDKELRAQMKDKDKIRLLLAEDSTFYRNMEKSYLTQEGFHVIEAENGKEALEILQTEKVDLVVTDIEMPYMNGFELTEQIRADDRLKHLPVIAVTSLTQDEERERGKKAGLDAYLIKLQREVLLREVHRLITEHRATS